jgi:ribosomal protein S18 acetylase RimI-like enzyme
VSGYEIQRVDADHLDLARRFFSVERATRHCWCTAFCSTRGRFAAGWYGGGNRRRFEALARSEPDPMGLLALLDGEPVGWCACGPRSRYLTASAGRASLLAGRPRDEDQHVWLVACIVVRPDHPGPGVVRELVRAAVAHAEESGASAIEAWPLAVGVRRPGDLHVGREGVFARLGFRCVQRPNAERAIMRFDVSDEIVP